MTTARWAGPLERRSFFSMGIIACKMGKSVDDCPFLESQDTQEQYRRDAWIEGFKVCDRNVKMRTHPLYELGESI